MSCLQSLHPGQVVGKALSAALAARPGRRQYFVCKASIQDKSSALPCLLRLQPGPVVVSVLSAKLPRRTSRRQSPCPVCSASNQGKPALSLSCPKHIYQGLTVGRVLSSHKQNVSSADRAHSQPIDKQNSFEQCRQL